MEWDWPRFVWTAVGTAIGPFVFITISAFCVWMARKWFPKAEWWMRAPMSQVIRRLVGRAPQAPQEVLPHESKPTRLRD